MTLATLIAALILCFVLSWWMSNKLLDGLSSTVCVPSNHAQICKPTVADVDHGHIDPAPPLPPMDWTGFDDGIVMPRPRQIPWFGAVQAQMAMMAEASEEWVPPKLQLPGE